MFASTILGRAAAVLGQIGIGWLLTPDDFGVWALALSMATAVVALRNGGTTQILIQRGASFPFEAQFFLRYSLLFNTFAGTILVALSVPYLIKHSALGVALLGIGLAVPLATPAMLYRAKMTIAGRFRPLAAINVCSATLWQVSIFALAYIGFGAASFACAPVLQAVFETVAGRLAGGRLPRQSGSRPFADYVALFRQSRWVMLSAAVLSLANTGDYFAVGTLTDMTTVGIYYFAFQTVVTLNMPMYNGLESVLPTMLVKLNEDTPRQMAALARAMRMAVVVALPLVITFALAAPLVVHVLWHGKWDVAIRPTQILAACVPAWLIIHATRALLEARGFWRLRFGLLAVNGVGGISSAALGTCFISVPNIALTVAVFYVSFAAAALFALGRLGLPTREMLTIGLKPLLLNCATLGATLALRHWGWPEAGIGIMDGATAGVFVFLAGVGNSLMFPQVWAELLTALTQATRRRRSADNDSQQSAPVAVRTEM
jgi:O-antigen/teichoic acid export membrane protein